jgi:hypothetical protein
MAIYDQKCNLSKRTNRQISLALVSEQSLSIYLERNIILEKHYLIFQSIPIVSSGLFLAIQIGCTVTLNK